MSTESDDVGEPDVQWPVRVKLKHPIEFGVDHIAELEFRRGRLGDLKGIKVGDIPPTDQLMMIASRMCNKPLKVIEMLDGDDAAEVIAIAIIFFAKCLPGGLTR